MHLPVEILEQVRALLISTKIVSTLTRKQIVLYVDDSFQTVEPRASPLQKEVPTRRGRDDLSALRLVNRAFCEVASRVLLNELRFRPYPISQNSPFPEVSIRQCLALSRGNYAGYVQKFDIKFEFLEGVEEAEGGAALRLIQDLAVVLPIVLASFRNLRSLSVKGPLRSIRRADGRERQLASSRIPRSLHSAEHRDAVRAVIINVFRYVPLSQLDKLTLHLPLTHDFEMLLQSLVKPNSAVPYHQKFAEKMERLNNLEIAFIYNPTEDGPNTTTPKERYPDVQYMPGLFTFISLTSHLTTLSLEHASISLNLDLLALHKLNFLQNVTLRRFTSSGHHLMKLIMQNQAHIQQISLQFITLTNGTWQEIFTRARELPRLRCFLIDWSGYAQPGGNLHGMITMFGKPGNDPELITAEEPLDYRTLLKLQQHVQTVQDAHPSGH